MTLGDDFKAQTPKVHFVNKAGRETFGIMPDREIKSTEDSMH